MSDNPTPYPGDAWQGADLVTVDGYGTVADILLSFKESDGAPDAHVLALAREIMRRDAEFEQMVQETAVENADLAQRLAEAERYNQGFIQSFDSVEEHYHLALAVVEAARAYVMPGGEAEVPALFDDVVASLARFDGFEGPVQVDAIAGDRVAVSAVPPYEGSGDETEEEEHPRPALSIVPDQG